MPENPWYMMRKNPLLPDDWGDREGMIRRRERLNLVAWAINTLPYAFEVSRTVGPYVDRLVYEVRSRGDADMFCSAVTSMSTDFRHETIRAWTMTPEAFDAGGKVAVDVASCHVRRPSANVVCRFIEFLRDGSGAQTDEEMSQGWRDAQEVPCTLGVDSITGNPIYIKFGGSNGHLFVNAPRPDAEGLVDTALIQLSLVARPHSVHLVMGERQDDPLQRYKLLPQHVEVCSTKQALEKGLEELNRRRAALDPYGCGFEMFNWSSAEAPMRSRYHNCCSHGSAELGDSMRLMVISIPDVENLLKEDAGFAKHAIREIERSGARYGVHLAATMSLPGTYYRCHEDSTNSISFCRVNSLFKGDWSSWSELPIPGGMLLSPSCLNRSGSGLGFALDPMDEGTFKAIALRYCP
ncbi:hypothetical protein IM763_01385 [Atopobiaceae bacterium FL090493]|uniref:hypothetical protein n=1 Tax=Adlercreutzia caecimuris TaxID=671266 RepID=UPI0019DFADE7|nr:hypothetical protein [Adlercreutzia caecimuris]MBF0598731.1 hypothetical protein [Atopobiaceae bacterium FL090493]